MDILAPILPLCCHKTDEAMRKMTARSFGALRKGLNRLKEYYQRLDSQASVPDNAALYPYPTNFVSLTDGLPRDFRYKSQFPISTAEKKLVFFGELEKEVPICIKFTRRYSMSAHEFCAKKGWAPELLGYEELPGGWRMIVMEDMVEHQLLNRSSAEDQEELHAKLRQILTELHAAGMVHGDFRDSNILTKRVQTGVDVKLVDFDWAGVVGEARYPANVNHTDIRRPVDARDEAMITAEHDMAMLGYLFS